jgi:hypothetical protein
MAQAQRRRTEQQETIQQRYQQADQILTQRLQTQGYTPPEAHEVVRIAHTLVGRTRKPKTPDLRADNPLHRRIDVNDLTSTAHALVEVYNNRERSVREILAGNPMYAGPTQAIALHEERAPAPVRVYNYSLSLTTAQGRTYNFEVTLNRDPHSVEGRGLAQQFFNMRNLPGVVVAATSGDRQVTPAEFWRAYQQVYRDVLGTTGTQASIDIHGIRHSRG